MLRQHSVAERAGSSCWCVIAATSLWGKDGELGMPVGCAWWQKMPRSRIHSGVDC